MVGPPLYVKADTLGLSSIKKSPPSVDVHAMERLPCVLPIARAVGH